MLAGQRLVKLSQLAIQQSKLSRTIIFSAGYSTEAKLETGRSRPLPAGPLLGDFIETSGKDVQIEQMDAETASQRDFKKL